MTNLTYTPSTMEKLLGSWYKWWYLTTFNFKANLNYLWDELFSLFHQIIGLIAVIIVFLYGNNGEMEINNILTYLIIGNVFYSLTNANIIYIIGNGIKHGFIANKLILPTSYFGMHLSISFANCTAFFISQGLALAPILFLFKDSVTFSINGLINLSWCFLFSWLIRFFIEMLSGFLAFWTTEIYGSANLTLSVITLLSGSLFPLTFLPKNLFWITQFLPFAFTFYHPMQIYLGKYDTNQTILIFLGGVIWCVILFFLAKLVFKLGLKRNESVGL